MPRAKQYLPNNVIYFDPAAHVHRKQRRPRYALALAVTLVSTVIAITLRAILQTQDSGFEIPLAPSTPPAVASAISRSFELCGRGPRTNCVIDGDTFWLDGIKIRIADINTPEISRPQCDHELALGQTAKFRLLDLLNAGPITLEPVAQEIDRFGRQLRIVSRNNTSLGDTLVREGLAHVWDGRRHSWCT